MKEEIDPETVYKPRHQLASEDAIGTPVKVEEHDPVVMKDGNRYISVGKRKRKLPTIDDYDQLP